jgi:hypothetical protein
VPDIKSRRLQRSNQYAWEEQDRTILLPVEPDALFSLCIPGRPAERQLLHFCYEVDRGSMPMSDMLKKFRAYYDWPARKIPLSFYSSHDMLSVLSARL